MSLKRGGFLGPLWSVDSAQLGFTKPPAVFLDGTGLLAPSLEVSTHLDLQPLDLLAQWETEACTKSWQYLKISANGNKSRTPPPGSVGCLSCVAE